MNPYWPDVVFKIGKTPYWHGQCQVYVIHRVAWVWSMFVLKTLSWGRPGQPPGSHSRKCIAIQWSWSSASRIESCMGTWNRKNLNNDTESKVWWVHWLFISSYELCPRLPRRSSFHGTVIVWASKLLQLRSVFLQLIRLNSENSDTESKFHLNTVI